MKIQQIGIAVLFILCSAIGIKAQTTNWAKISEDPVHLITVHAGLQHGVIFGISYGYRIKSRLPIIAHLDCSIPSGKKLFDDFKISPGAQIRLIEYKGFRLSTTVNGIVRRRHESTTVTLFNLGTEAKASIGYYKSHWFAAMETGFDKAIATRFKHSQAYRDNYPLVQDGWYKPSTGGNFYYGMQLGCSSGKHDVYLKAGKVIAQDFKSKPQVPFYGQLGYTLRIGKEKEQKTTENQ